MSCGSQSIHLVRACRPLSSGAEGGKRDVDRLSLRCEMPLAYVLSKWLYSLDADDLEGWLLGFGVPEPGMVSYALDH